VGGEGGLRVGAAVFCGGDDGVADGGLAFDCVGCIADVVGRGGGYEYASVLTAGGDIGRDAYGVFYEFFFARLDLDGGGVECYVFC